MKDNNMTNDIIDLTDLLDDDCVELASLDDFDDLPTVPYSHVIVAALFDEADIVDVTWPW